ncbi:MAG: hypothetical protein ISP90_00280 [Nevskia sp.]|nr:hypothetical protein [Nevskia sp.]
MKLFPSKQPKESATTAKAGAQPACCGGQANTAEPLAAAKPAPARKADSSSPSCCGGKHAP